VLADLLKVQPFLGPEFDTPPGGAGDRTRTYVVCATPRSGSTLLCQALASTGVAAMPMEYFNPVTRAILGRRWGCGPGLDAYAQSVLERRTSPAGTFGLKLHWHQFEAICREREGRELGAEPLEQSAAVLEELLAGRPAYVRLVRADLDRQAVSLWTAEYSRVWARAAGADERPSARVPYSFAGIRRCRDRIAVAEARWHGYFRSGDIEPAEVVYEDLCGALDQTVERVLDQLLPGVSAERAQPRPIGARLADARSAELLARFRADLDRHGPEWFERPLRWRVRARMASLLRRG
jgi:LPS sulfotransferase NodH